MYFNNRPYTFYVENVAKSHTNWLWNAQISYICNIFVT